MESRSYFIASLMAWALIVPSNAKQSLEQKQDVALKQVISADKASFVRSLKKAMQLNSKYIKKLKNRQDVNTSILLEKAISYEEQLQSKDASRETIISKLKEQNTVLRIIDQRIKLKTAETLPSSNTDMVPISGKLSVGQTDHSPAKQIKQTDYFEPTITVPLNIGARVGLDKLIEEE